MSGLEDRPEHNEPPPRPRRMRNVAVIAGALALIGGVAYWFTTDDDERVESQSSSVTELDAAPIDQPEKVWTTNVDATNSVEADRDNIYVGSNGLELTVTALRRDDGTVRWEQRVEPRGDYDVGFLAGAIDGVVLAVVCERDTCELHGLSSADGDALWDEELERGRFGVDVSRGIVFENEGDRAKVLDPATGNTVASATGDPIGRLDGVVYSIESDTGSNGESFFASIAALDERTFESLTDEPLQGSESYSAFVFDGERWLVAEQNTLLVFDAQGQPVGSSPTSVATIRNILAVGNGNYAVDGDGKVVGLALEDGRAVERWEAEGAIRPTSQAFGGPPLLAPASNGVVHVIVDTNAGLEVRNAVTGEVVYDGDASSVVYAASNAVLAGEYRQDADVWDGRSIDPSTGEVIWRLETDGGPRLIDGGVIGLGANDDITLYE